jgi:hypothetical protein
MFSIVSLSDAVVSELNAEEWSVPFAAQRLYRPRFEPADLRALQVSVVPRSIAIEATSRGEDSYQYQVDIAIQQRVSRVDVDWEDEVAPLLGLVHEVAQYFRMRRLRAIPEALCVRVEIDPVYAIEHLDELNVLTSVLTLTFQVVGV